MIRLYHNEVGHGVEKNGITSHYWFTCLKLKVRHYKDNCMKYLFYLLPASRQTERWIRNFRKRYRIISDAAFKHFGPLEETDKFKHIVIAVNAFTKFIWLFATKSTGIKEVTNCLTLLFVWQSKKNVRRRGSSGDRRIPREPVHNC